MPADVDSLPPTEYLVMDVLAARARLGETCWTFPSRLRHTADSLGGRGLVWWKHGVMPRTIQVFLTEEGRAAVLSDSYRGPVMLELERLRARVADLEPFEPRTTGFHVGEDGPVVDVHFPESFAQQMLASFRAYLDEHQAPNYVHMPMTDITTGETYCCTIGRPGGKSPHELRREAEGMLVVAAQALRNLAARWEATSDGYDAQADCASELRRVITEKLLAGGGSNG